LKFFCITPEFGMSTILYACNTAAESDNEKTSNIHSKFSVVFSLVECLVCRSNENLQRLKKV
jgi:hypothetical protein